MHLQGSVECHHNLSVISMQLMYQTKVSDVSKLHFSLRQKKKKKEKKKINANIYLRSGKK